MASLRYILYKEIIIMKSILGIETAYMGILSIGFLKRVGVLFRELELGPYLLSICIQMKVLESQKTFKQP